MIPYLFLGLDWVDWPLNSRAVDIRSKRMKFRFSWRRQLTQFCNAKIQGVIHPFLMDYFVNEVNSEWRYEAVPFPDTDIHEMSGSLSFTIGDFVETYSSPRNCRMESSRASFSTLPPIFMNICTLYAMYCELEVSGSMWGRYNGIKMLSFTCQRTNYADWSSRLDSRLCTGV